MSQISRFYQPINPSLLCRWTWPQMVKAPAEEMRQKMGTSSRHISIHTICMTTLTTVMTHRSTMIISWGRKTKNRFHALSAITPPPPKATSSSTFAHTRARNHTPAQTVHSPPPLNTISKYIWERTQVKSHSHVHTVLLNSHRKLTSKIICSHTRGRNLFPVSSAQLGSVEGATWEDTSRRMSESFVTVWYTVVWQL